MAAPRDKVIELVRGRVIKSLHVTMIHEDPLKAGQLYPLRYFRTRGFQLSFIKASLLFNSPQEPFTNNTASLHTDLSSSSIHHQVNILTKWVELRLLVLTIIITSQCALWDTIQVNTRCVTKVIRLKILILESFIDKSRKLFQHQNYLVDFKIYWLRNVHYIVTPCTTLCRERIIK